MRRVGCLLALAAFTVLQGSRARAEPYHNQPGSFEAVYLDADWQDTPRNRQVPVRIWYPKTGDGPFPIIIFSHGLGGNREGYAIHGRFWASWGYVVCHVQHLGSDDAIWRGNRNAMAGMKRAAADPRNMIDRPKDVTFAIDQMIALNGNDGPLKGRLDTKQIGMSGHSFGGYTTLASSGLVFPILGRNMTLGDKRIVASIAMCAAGGMTQRADPDVVYGGIKVPMLHLTGTNDNNPIADTTPEQRRYPYDHIKAPHQALVNYQGGDHMVFAVVPRLGEHAKLDARIQDLYHQCCLAFWDSWLKGDTKARDWLYAGGYTKEMGADGTFETK